MFSSFPNHAFKHEACKALPNENDRDHGLTTYNLFIAFKFCDAYYSLCPPERNYVEVSLI